MNYDDNHETILRLRAQVAALTARAEAAEALAAGRLTQIDTIATEGSRILRERDAARATLASIADLHEGSGSGVVSDSVAPAVPTTGRSACDERCRGTCATPPRKACEYGHDFTCAGWSCDNPAHRAPDPAPAPGVFDLVEVQEGPAARAAAEARAREYLGAAPAPKHPTLCRCKDCRPAPAVTREEVVEALRELKDGYCVWRCGTNPFDHDAACLRARLLLGRIDAEEGRK